jgi:hypothetical protein
VTSHWRLVHCAAPFPPTASTIGAREAHGHSLPGVVSEPAGRMCHVVQGLTVSLEWGGEVEDRNVVWMEDETLSCHSKDSAAERAQVQSRSVIPAQKCIQNRVIQVPKWRHQSVPTPPRTDSAIRR